MKGELEDNNTSTIEIARGNVRATQEPGRV